MRAAGALLLCTALAAAACSRAEQPKDAVAGDGNTAAASAEAPKETYPAPRWPSYFKPPTSVDDLMPSARQLARNLSGFQGKGMGILQPGESVLIVANNDDDPMVLEAIKRALVERKVTPHIKFSYELQGIPKEEIERRAAETTKRDKVNAGVYQASGWIEGQFPNPDQPKKWLKDRDAKLYAELFPDEVDGQPRRRQQSGTPMGEAIKAFLTANPEVRGVFWGGGGTTGLRRQLYPMQDKYLGTFIQGNVYNLQSQMTSYPGDVWQLAEEQLLEPLVYVSRIEVTDPEGMNLWSDLTEDMAERWAQGSYQRGHLYMFPNQATGRFGYSFVDYPAFNKRWLPREPIARINGTLAATQGHGGFFPRWEVIFKDGFIADVKGGGAQGAALKHFLQYPGINELTYPYHKTPGYWYLYEIAFGSHPKGFRHPMPLLESGNTSPERARSAVIHWGLGIRLWHDPDAPTESKEWMNFTEKHNVPRDHGWHSHTYFTTYKVRLRNADKWVNLLDKGRMVSLDNPEVRALASRYGDPDYLLAEDWVPEVPGINAPGDYMRDYAPNPGAYSMKVLDKAMKGTYEHYFPPVGTNTTMKASAPTSTAAQPD
jgi:hypothetical protein